MGIFSILFYCLILCPVSLVGCNQIDLSTPALANNYRTTVSSGSQTGVTALSSAKSHGLQFIEIHPTACVKPSLQFQAGREGTLQLRLPEWHKLRCSKGSMGGCSIRFTTNQLSHKLRLIIIDCNLFFTPPSLLKI